MAQKAVGLVRVSTGRQVRDGVSMVAQQDRIKAWAEAHGAELLEVFEDAGVSGARSDREGLQAALEAACREKAVLVVYSLSRLSRSTRDTLAIAERLDKTGADLVSLSEKIDTTSAAGKMIFRMLAVLNEFERDQIAERIQTALDYKREQKEKLGGSLPFGYRLAEDGKHLEQDEAEQEMVREIQSLRGQGMTYRRVLNYLRAEFPTRCRGKQWRLALVHAICRREEVGRG